MARLEDPEDQAGPSYSNLEVLLLLGELFLSVLVSALHHPGIITATIITILSVLPSKKNLPLSNLVT